MDRRHLLRAAGGVVLAGILPGAADAAVCRIFPPDGRIDFLALRHDRTIGYHRIRFARRRGDFVVRTDIEMSVGPAGARVFALKHHAEEAWRGGWLHAVVSDTQVDERLYRVRAERRDGIFQGVVNGTGFTVSGYIIPSSLWNHDTVFSESLFDTIDARVKLVRARRLGAERVVAGGRRVEAEHFGLRGEIPRELWYDRDCRLVRAGFIARDGSRVVLEAI